MKRFLSAILVKLGIDKDHLRQMVELIEPHWKKLALSVLCMVGVGWAVAGTAYLIRPVLDQIFVKKDDAMLKLLPLAVLVLVTVKGMCLWGNSYLTAFVGQSVVAEIRRKLHDHIQMLPLAFFDNNKIGDLMSRMLNDVDFLQNTATDTLTGLVRDGFSAIGLLYVVFYQNWRLALIALVLLPAGFYPLFKITSVIRELARKGLAYMAEITIRLHESLGSIRIVKAFGMEDYEKKRFQEVNDLNLKFSIKIASITALSSPIMEFLGGLVIVFTVWYGGWSVIHGKTTPGAFFSFIAALLMLYEPVKRINKTIGMLPVGFMAASRVFDIMKAPREVTDHEGALEPASISRTIEFRKVCFSYGGDRVLNDINFTAHVGEVIALVGMSGAGKTTLVNLIPRFYDVTQGAIFIDGVDIREFKLSALRSLIGMVTQQSILFNDTVRNNIAYGDIAKGEEQIIAAAKAANAYDFIMKLPLGLDTHIGDQGIRLSGGERQRLCIARALLKNAPVLILDEATSSLDSGSESEVQSALDNLMVGRTTFVIAHRLSTIRNADRIFALTDGMILEEGRHDELLRRGGEYSRLYELQFAHLQ
ncbi:MAG: ABC transporter ATP-binding protein [Syntrophobacteraceae bacterium]|nr:ABC transporter ATP-binding protein [Syntrophobacteraceae bacterium]